MIVVLLLVLVTTIFANPSVYVVSGARLRHNGIYERKKEPEFHYKQLTDYYGHSSFLYTDSSRPNTWIIGYGPTFSTAVAYYIAPATAGRPAFTQWSFVRDKSRHLSPVLLSIVPLSTNLRVLRIKTYFVVF